MAEPHNKVRSVRLTGGRLSGEHQRGTKTTVVISGTACIECGSTLVRLSKDGDTCEGCRVKAKKEIEEKKETQRILEDCRKQAGRASIGKILRMLDINTSALHRHRISLHKNSTASYAIQEIIGAKVARSQKFVDIWQEALEARLSSDANPSKGCEDKNIDARRKYVLSRLSAGDLRTIDVLKDVSLNETLLHTYALSLLVSQYGIQPAVSAFRSANLPIEIACTEKWKQKILQVDATLADPTTRDGAAIEDSRPATRALTSAERRDLASARLLKSIEHGMTTLEMALEDRRTRRTIGRCRLHDVINALCADVTYRAEVKTKLGGTSQRKLEDMSKLELARLIRLTESCD
ncbi:hypothetical protein [Streptomyces sp. CdTB01]|uniref:hypothetical protein n=1 Tax=Streptomyces sp. CdTB01 TaxID=1725411 RepID=UPI000A866459|nr:hypothetical protein [Streptomyces sp. CdTB01]